MRTILRRAAKTLAVLLWIVKGLLLVLAVVVLVLWPVSRSEVRGIFVRRITLQPYDELLLLQAGSFNGRVFIVRMWSDFFYTPVITERPSAGLSWHAGHIPLLHTDSDTPEFLGVFRCYFDNFRDNRHATDEQYFSAPCWLVAPLLALWPLTSLTLLIRRHRKRRRLPLIGCCATCGYDLRATAAAGGPLLSRCPECGAESAAGGLKREWSATENTEGN